MLTGRRWACVNATTAKVFPVLGKPSMTTCVSSELRLPRLRTSASVSQGCVPASVRSSHLRRETNGLPGAPVKAATDLTWWARQVLNLRPLACEASALPLSYAPPGGWPRYHPQRKRRRVPASRRRPRRTLRSGRLLLMYGKARVRVSHRLRSLARGSCEHG